MSRFPLNFAARVSLLALAGCMYPPMYQQPPYGQQMYAPPGGMAPSGTMVIPPSNAPLYTPGGSTYSLPTSPKDNFIKPEDSSDSRFFGPKNENEQVPLPSDAGSGTGAKPRPFASDLGDLEKTP